VDDYTQTNAGLPKITWEIIKKQLCIPEHKWHPTESTTVVLPKKKKNLLRPSVTSQTTNLQEQEGKVRSRKASIPGARQRPSTNGYQEASSHAMAAKLTRAGGRGKEKRRKTKRNDGA
jgi:hypothetical protein